MHNYRNTNYDVFNKCYNDNCITYNITDNSCCSKNIVGKSQKYFKRQQDYLGHVNGEVEETYSGQNIVKVFNGEEKAIEQFEKMNNELYHSGWKSQFLSGLMHPIMNFIGNVGYVAISILGGYLVIQNKITVGNIQSFIQYNKQFTAPINQIAQISGMLQSMIAASERVFEFIEEKDEIETLQDNIDTSKIEGNIEFKNIKFGYNPDKIVINDFSANVKKDKNSYCWTYWSRKNNYSKIINEIL